MVGIAMILVTIVKIVVVDIPSAVATVGQTIIQVIQK